MFEILKTYLHTREFETFWVQMEHGNAFWN